MADTGVAPVQRPEDHPHHALLAELTELAREVRVERVDPNRFEEKRGGTKQRTQGYFKVRLVHGDPDNQRFCKLVRTKVDALLKKPRGKERGFQLWGEISGTDKRKIAEKKQAREAAGASGAGNHGSFSYGGSSASGRRGGRGSSARGR